MSDMAPIPKDHPLWLEWIKYKATSEYQSTKQWALTEAHVDGSLWEVFRQGFTAALDAALEKSHHLGTDWGDDVWVPAGAIRALKAQQEDK